LIHNVQLSHIKFKILPDETSFVSHLQEADRQSTSLGNAVLSMILAGISFGSEFDKEERSGGVRATLKIPLAAAGNRVVHMALKRKTGTLKLYGYDESDKPAGYSLLKSLFDVGSSKSKRRNRDEMVDNKIRFNLS
jgi:hypothetical protein